VTDAETKHILRFILEALKQQAQYLHRQHGWLIAVAESLKANPEMDSALRQHPFYDQGPQPLIPRTDAMIRNIDLLIENLKNRD